MEISLKKMGRSCHDLLLFILYFLSIQLTSYGQSKPLVSNSFPIPSEKSPPFGAPLEMPASLGFLSQTSIGLLSENRFLTAPLSLERLTVSIPFQYGGIGIGLRNFGHSYYQRTSFGIASGLPFSGSTSGGVGILVERILIGEGHGKTLLPSFSLGLYTKLSSNWGMSVQGSSLHFRNRKVNSILLNDPPEFELLFHKDQDGTTRLLFGVRKKIKGSLEGILIVKGRLFKGTSLSTGIRTTPLRPFLSITIPIRHHTLTLGSGYHPSLQVIPFIRLGVRPDPDSNDG